MSVHDGGKSRQEPLEVVNDRRGEIARVGLERVNDPDLLEWTDGHSHLFHLHLERPRSSLIAHGSNHI